MQRALNTSYVLHYTKQTAQPSHDLRHTWASWHIQSGTSLQELQQLGGWSSFEMVLRYAHLSGDHLQRAANKINGIGLGREVQGIARL